jgi:hypothetical protein
MKHATQKKTVEVKIGQLYRMPSGAIAKVVHMRGDSEVGLEYENKRYKGRAEQVAMSTSNVKKICTYLGEVNEPQS